jgi:hypothetical protein
MPPTPSLLQIILATISVSFSFSILGWLLALSEGVFVLEPIVFYALLRWGLKPKGTQQIQALTLGNLFLTYLRIVFFFLIYTLISGITLEEPLENINSVADALTQPITTLPFVLTALIQVYLLKKAFPEQHIFRLSGLTLLSLFITYTLYAILRSAGVLPLWELNFSI